MSERDPLGWAAILAAMTLVVYVTRAGGYWLIGRITIGPRLRMFSMNITGSSTVVGRSISSRCPGTSAWATTIPDRTKLTCVSGPSPDSNVTTSSPRSRATCRTFCLRG